MSSHRHPWPFVERVYLEGVRPERIARETGIPRNVIRNYLAAQGLAVDLEARQEQIIADARAALVRSGAQAKPGGRDAA